MTKELQEKLYDKYPTMFAQHEQPMSQTCMCWGCSCGDGWYHILDHMCEQLAHIQDTYDILVIFDQIKEKFGCLRVYHHVENGDRWTKEGDSKTWKLDGKAKLEYVTMGWTSYGKKMPAYEGVERLVDEVIRMACDFSEITCENCGMTGATPTEGGWISTLCDTCKEKKNKGESK